MIKMKRIYEMPDEKDGFRVLVDRLWPRGLSKNEAEVDLWLKDIAPSDELRKWFAHDPKKWDVFEKKYKTELKKKEDLLHRIKQIEREKGTITVLFAAKDERHNNAVILRDILQR